MNGCGKDRHAILEFQGLPTAPAAAYPLPLCEKLATFLVHAAGNRPSSEQVRQQVKFVSEGKVARHTLRGGTLEGKLEVRRREDEASLAGMRNPASVIRVWPELCAAMAPVRQALLRAINLEPRLRNLASACGESPSRKPPPQECIDKARASVAQSLGLSRQDAEVCHPASPWKARLVGKVQDLANDPDMALRTWLEHGAPMGLSSPIQPGGLFPPQSGEAEMTLEDLADAQAVKRNHPLFSERHGQLRSPGLDLLAEQVNEGFGLLFSDKSAAETFLGGQAHPAPLGNITKEKPGGGVKHRLIQDLKNNSVNSAVVLTERQVLPRPIDHAKDVALLSEDLRKGEGISTLVLDFKNAFMSIPLDKAERRFNCAHVEESISLSRPKIEKEEATKGHVVVWRVLGFGGRPNPLVYSRAESFAMRSAQALLGPPVRSSQHQSLSRSRGQLYVDDPVWTHAGTLRAKNQLRQCRKLLHISRFPLDE
jgi:hypothetical protein